MVISGSDVGEADAGVAVPDDGADADGEGEAAAGADEAVVAADDAASVGPGAAAAPLAGVALPLEAASALGVEAVLDAAALPALAFDVGAVVAGGFVEFAAAGGCAAASAEFVAFGDEEFPCAGAGPAAPPCGAFAGGAFCAGGGV